MRSFLFILLLLPVTAFCQNWCGIIKTDTAYYTAKDTINQINQPNNLQALRVTWLDSLKQNSAGDYTYFLVPSVRSFGNQTCVDTLSGNWLGKQMIVLANGSELYFNSFSDTIFVNNNASLNSSWIMAKDTSGLFIRATVTSSGAELVDGVTDSVKSMTLQAYSGTTPVADYYNGKTIKLSKSHGWLAIYEMNGFPNNLYTSSGIAARYLPSLHTRVDKKLSRVVVNKIDLSWKYLPGNEWIYWHVYGSSSGSYIYKNATHDSVISSVLYGQNQIVATIQTRTFYATKVHPLSSIPAYDSTFSRNFVHTDTISQNNTGNIGLMENTIWPETKTTFIGNGAQVQTSLQDAIYSLDTMICDRYNIATRSTATRAIAFLNGCWRDANHYDPLWHDNNFLEGFGNIYQYDFQNLNQVPIKDDKTTYTYLKLGGCEYGTKENLLALGVSKPVKETLFTVYPNPATTEIFISSTKLALSNTSVSLVDMTGRVIKEQGIVKSLTAIPINNVAAGVYFIAITTEGSTQQSKIIIQ